MKTQPQSFSSIATGIFLSAGTIGLILLTQYRELYRVSDIVGALSIGFLVGCFPYYQSKRTRNLKLGQIALASCTLSGLILGVFLSIPTAIVFSSYIKER
jgi:hypothetical protein